MILGFILVDPIKSSLQKKNMLHQYDQVVN